MKRNNQITYTTEEILQGIINKDDKVHDYLFSNILPMIIHHVKSNSGTREDGEDLFQDALIALHSRVEKGPLTISCKFSTYFYEICKKMWLKKLKRRKTLRDKGIDVNETLRENIEAELETDFWDTEEYLLYRKHLKRLNKRCREIIRLRKLNWSYKEIMNELYFTSEGQARKYSYNCNKKLTQMIRTDPVFKELTQKGYYEKQ